MRVSKPIVGLVSGVIVVAGVIVGLTVNANSTAQAGMGLPTVDLLDDEFASAPAEGRVSVAVNGCFLVDAGDGPLFAIWPEGYTHGGDAVVASDDERIAEGARIEGEFAVASRAEVIRAADGADGYLDMATGYCTDDTDVLVLESLR